MAYFQARNLKMAELYFITHGNPRKDIAGMESWNNWYVVQVNTGSEHTVQQIIARELDNAGIAYEDCFVPLAEFVRKIDGAYQKMVKPMFPGYIFLISQNIDVVHMHLKHVSAYTRILGAPNTFVPLYPEEVRLLLSFSQYDHNVTMSYGFIENDSIYIEEGPLVGKEGLIRKINRHKRIAEVEFNFMRRKTVIRMPLEIISKK